MTVIKTDISKEYSVEYGSLLSTRPSRTERDHRANLVIYLDNENGVYIAKNRYGNTGKVNTEDLVDILCHILSDHLFNGRIKLFQEGMKWRLKKAINRIIKKGVIK